MPDTTILSSEQLHRFISPIRNTNNGKAIIASHEALRAQVATAREEAIADAVKIIDTWHYKKGGYGILAEAVRSLTTEKGQKP